MTVSSVTKMWSKEGGAVSCEKADAFDQKFSFTEGYSVVHSVDDGTDTIIEAVGIPDYGAQHSSGKAAFVIRKDRATIGPILSVVTVSYEGESPDPDSVDVEWTDSSTSEPIDRDYDGAAILTANGEPVEGLSMDVYDDVVIIRRKFLTINKFTIRAYKHATNSDTFLGWPPGTARLVSHSAKNKFKYNAAQEQWDVTARVVFRQGLAGATDAQAWYKRWRHEGLYVKSGSIVRRALDSLGHEISKPVLLKADGTQETNPNNALFVYTQVYGSLPYSALGLV